MYSAIEELSIIIRGEFPSYTTTITTLPHNIECLVILFDALPTNLLESISEVIGLHWSVGAIKVPKGTYVMITPS